MSDKLCPLMNMAPCAGQDCVFFLDDIKVRLTKPDVGKEIAVSADNLPAIPCAFIYSGINSFIQVSSEIGKSKLS